MVEKFSDKDAKKVNFGKQMEFRKRSNSTFVRKADRFWNQHPALLYGMAGWSAASLALFPSVLPIAILILLSLSAMHTPARLFLMIVFTAASFSWAKLHYQLPQLQEERVEGIAEVDLKSVNYSKTAFGNRWVYRGILRGFTHSESNHSIVQNIPVRLTIPAEQNRFRPEAGYTYILKTFLKNDVHGNYQLTPIKKRSKNDSGPPTWKRIQKLWSLAEWRYEIKSSFQAHLQKIYRETHVSSFITGIATGEFYDRLLSFELNRFGLLHLMAISGLHFSLIASFLLMGATMILPRKIAATIVLTLLGVYFLILGISPSVFRAWIAIAIALSSIFLHRHAHGLNSLGIALLAALFWDPFWIKQIAFQFSFMITASILLFAAPCERMLERVFYKRNLSQMIQLGTLDQHGYCLLALLRKGIALAIAVNLTALPLTLFHFQQFPLLSFLYNLFFPFLVSLCLLLLLVALTTALIFPLAGNFLHAINETYTKWLLHLVCNLPKNFDTKLYYSSLTTEALACYLIALLGLGILVHQPEK